MGGRIFKFVLPVFAVAGFSLAFVGCAAAQVNPISSFTAGDIVVSVEGNGPQTPGATYGDNQAAPLSLYEFGVSGTTSASLTGGLVLPQTASGANFAISGEYGSSSEGTLQLSGNGQYLTIMGYGINATTFNSNPGIYGPVSTNTALAQSGSLTGQSYTPIPRVVALIGANGSVNTSTAIYNVFDQNNPRSAYTINGSSIYISGQGASGDATGGVFLVPGGSVTTSPTPITGLDATGNTVSQDTREVQIYNNTLYVSVDSKAGSGNNRSFIGTLGSPPATTLYTNGGTTASGPTMLPGFGNTGGTGKVTISIGSNSNGNSLNNTTALSNGVAQNLINLSPENYFFASPSVLYVADSGDPKNNSNGLNNSNGTLNIGDGGLQKWVNSNPNGTGTWSLAYTLSAGLDLVNNGNTDGVSGLYGLTGEVVGNEVELFATSFVLSDLDQTYLYGITDLLSATTASAVSGETFTTLALAPTDADFKGVAFAPTPLPSSWTFMLLGLCGFGVIVLSQRSRKRAGYAVV